VTGVDAVVSAAEMSQRCASWRASGESVGLVPTMGALHEGHLALVREAGTTYDRVVVSIFVNPLQFGPAEDFSRYPRDLERDIASLEGLAVDAVFAPSVDQMYPAGSEGEAPYRPGPIARRYEGAHRPGHFDGVVHAVYRLFDIVRPDGAFFGHKDAQQLIVIRQMVTALALPITIHAVETVRAADGLALSSRNDYLSAEERAAAATLPRALERAAAQLSPGEAIEAARAECAGESGLELEYVDAVDPETFEPLSANAEGDARVIVAARVGQTRLIDNRLARFGQ